jgi:hypothetical protein
VKRVLSGDAATAHRIALQLTIATSIDLRLDRLLASELGLSRNQIKETDEKGLISIESGPRRRLRAPVWNGMRIAIDLSTHGERRRIALAAAGLPTLPTSPSGLMAACSP